jgi:hypothetical protein
MPSGQPSSPASEAAATASPAAPRIAGSAAESSLVPLRGNVTSMAQARFDQGAAPTTTRLTHVRLVLRRSPAQEAALRQYLAELQQKASPNYHKWLTPEQFGRLYGPSDADIEAITGWLKSAGLSVDAVSPGRTNIEFSGPVGTVESAFRTSIHSFKANGQEFLSNVSDPQIPSALAPVVAGVAHLGTLKPKSAALLGPTGRFDAATGKRQVVATPSDGPAPAFTFNPGPNYLYAVASDLATIYDTPNKTLNGNYSSGNTYDGTGVTVGIGGDSAITPSYVSAYRSLFVGNTTPPTVTNVDGVSENGDDVEAYLDAEVSGGLAPGANIHLYVSSDLFSGIEQALSDNTVDIFSLSFTECELGFTTADNAIVSGWWQQAAAQGIAVTVATGDSGSANCDNPNSVEVAENGLQVNGLASTPYNIAVGGTDFYVLPSNFTQYVTGASFYGSTGSANYYRSALGYIPESTWNDSTSPNTSIADNSYTQEGIAAGGGGTSSCSTNTTSGSTAGSCISGYSKPIWQQGAGVPADGARDIPDVSLLASNGFDQALYLLCFPDGSYQECQIDSSGGFYFSGVGGTSAAAPAFAGILALVQQKAGGRLGQAAAELYALANSSYGGSVFHDVTVGDNSVFCNAYYYPSSCTQVASGWYFLTGYNTTAGYDEATGLGSVDVTNLVNDWGAATGSTATTVTVTPASSAIDTAQSLSVAIKVSGSPAPTGTVALSGGGYISAAAALASGTATITVPAGKLAVGADTLTASYSGDLVYSAASGTAKVTVATAVPASVTVVSGSGQSAVYGSAYAAPLAVVVKDSHGDALPGVTVTFSGTGLKLSSASAVTGANGQASITATAASVGNLTVAAATAGVTKTAAFALTATKAKLTVTATNASVAYNQPIPSLADTITGFVNGDTSKAATGAPVKTTTAKQGSAPGTYPITLTQGTLAATDYTFVTVNGTLTITPLGTVTEPSAKQTGTITITEATSGATIYYTTDGSTPTTSSKVYTGPISVSGSEVVKFIAVKAGYTTSAVRTVTDTIQ